MQKGDVKKASALMMTAVFAGFLLFFLTGYFTIAPSYVSFLENRYLAKKPELSLKSLTDGSFGEGLEDYMSDHITMRNELVMLHVDLNRLMGKYYQGGVYLAEDNYYIRESHFTEDAADLFAEEANRFAEEAGVPVDIIVVPETGIMLKDKLPSDYSRRTFERAEKSVDRLSEKLSDRIGFYYAKEPVRELIDSGVQAFYRNDHHWTTECTKAVFDWYAESSGLEVPDIPYEKHVVEGYCGNTFSLAPSFFAVADEFRYYTNPNGEYTVICNDESPKDSMIDNNQLLAKEKYDMFFGSDKATIRISSNAKKGSVLVLHDSFGRAFLPFLADSCSEVFSIDQRHFDTEAKPVAQLCREQKAERVILLYYTDSLSYYQFRRF